MFAHLTQIALILGMFVHYMPLSCTSWACNPLFLNVGARCWSLYVSRASYARVQAGVGVGTVLIWDFGVAYTRGGGYGHNAQNFTPPPPSSPTLCKANWVD